jgi:redox-sensitive bicupin YhaK (pirin superfamily)
VVDALFKSAGSLVLPPEHEERAVHVVEGAVSIDGTRVAPGCMLVVAPDGDIVVTADGPARVLLCGGAALDGERHMWWNFVSSRRERIEQAKSDWLAQRLGSVPGESEFIPLPER